MKAITFSSVVGCAAPVRLLVNVHMCSFQYPYPCWYPAFLLLKILSSTSDICSARSRVLLLFIAQKVSSSVVSCARLFLTSVLTWLLLAHHLCMWSFGNFMHLTSLFSDVSNILHEHFSPQNFHTIFLTSSHMPMKTCFIALPHMSTKIFSPHMSVKSFSGNFPHLISTFLSRFLLHLTQSYLQGWHLISPHVTSTSAM